MTIPRARGARNLALRLLVVAIVPVFAVTTSVRADAQTTAGASKDFSFIDNTKPGTFSDRTQCAGTARWVTRNGTGPGTVAPTANIEWSLSCTTGFDVASSKVTLKFPSTGPGACAGTFSSGAFQVDGHPVNTGSTSPVIGTLNSGLGQAPACTVNQVCWETVSDSHAWVIDIHHDGCISLGIGSPPAYTPDPTGSLTCTSVSVTKPVALGAPYDRTRASSGGYHQWIQDYETTLTFSGTQPAYGYWVYSFDTSTSSNAIANYGLYAQATGVPDATTKWDVRGSISDSRLKLTPPFRWSGKVVTGSAGSSVTVRWSQQLGVEVATGTGASSIGITPVGFGIGAIPSTSSVAIASTSVYAGSGSGFFDTRGVMGRSENAACAWYWGAQILDDPATSYDTPLGTMDSTPPSTVEPPALTNPTPPPASSSGCGFDFSDPSTWSSAATCAAIGVLQKIFGVLAQLADQVAQLVAKIASLVVDLVAAFTDLLKMLFIPSPSSWDVGPLLDSFNSRPPGSLIVGMSTFVSGAASSFTTSGQACSLWSADPDNFMNDVTCADVTSTTGIGALYAVAQATIVGVTAYSCFRMLLGQVASNS